MSCFHHPTPDWQTTPALSDRRVPIRVYLSGHAKLGRLTSYATMDVHLSTLHEWLTEFLPIDMSPESLDVGQICLKL